MDSITFSRNFATIFLKFVKIYKSLLPYSRSLFYHGIKSFDQLINFNSLLNACTNSFSIKLNELVKLMS